MLDLLKELIVPRSTPHHYQTLGLFSMRCECMKMELHIPSFPMSVDGKLSKTRFASFRYV